MSEAATRPSVRCSGGKLVSGARFLVVGAVATLVTIGLFNLLVHAGTRPVLNSQPIMAYAVAMVVGLTVNYVGNRFWAFESSARQSTWRQIVGFLVVNAIAFAIPALCLGVSRYLLGLDSALADNISANLVGLGLATATRWWLYSRVVFRRSA